MWACVCLQSTSATARSSSANSLAWLQPDGPMFVLHRCRTAATYFGWHMSSGKLHFKIIVAGKIGCSCHHLLLLQLLKLHVFWPTPSPSPVEFWHIFFCHVNTILRFFYSERKKKKESVLQILCISSDMANGVSSLNKRFNFNLSSFVFRSLDLHDKN